MKRFLVGHRGWIAGILLLECSLTMRAADVMDDLEGFRQKIAAAEAKPSADNPVFRGAQLYSIQLKQLENLIKRDDDDRAVQLLESSANYGLPPQFQDEWQRISALLTEELEKRKAGRLEKWAASVDQLVKDTKKTCLEAKAPEDLDGLLLRCSAAQMQANRGSDVMNERLSHKLQGVVQTLSGWASYLDFRNAGDKQRANNILRGLISNGFAFPILTVQEIESKLADVADAQMDIRTAIAKVFAGINSPDDLPTALERIQSYSGNPQNQQFNQLRTEAPRISAYMEAWKSAQAGDATTALAMLNRSLSSLEEAQRYYTPIKGQIESRVLKDKVGAWTKLPQNPNEAPRDYLARILDEMKERADYATMLEVMAFASEVERTGKTLASLANRQAIEQFLAGQRFEKVGDGVAAITSYRLVVGLPASKYAPTDKAAEALTGLLTKYPEAFKSYEGVLSEQIRGLSQQIQMLQQNRLPGFPYRP
jgi:hypothetical protein